MTKLIVTDLDGTFLRGHTAAHPENVRAVRRALDSGIRFAVASGRTAASCSLLMQRAGLMDAYIIGTNGCQLWEAPFGRVLRTRYLQEEAARRTIQVILAQGLDCCLYTEDVEVYSSEAMLYPDDPAETGQTYAQEMASVDIRVRTGLQALADAPLSRAMKVFAVCNGPHQQAAFEKALHECAAIDCVEITSSWRDNFEAMPRGVDKAQGVSELMEMQGITWDEVIAFGDSDNDLRMLKSAGLGYAMANANERVLQCTPLRAPRSEDAGVAKVIHAMLDREERQ